MKSNKKKIIIPVLLLLLLIGLRGTIAWLTATDEKINQFSVGEINNPTTDPDGNNAVLTGNLYEKNWNPNENHKLVPGISFTKEPYVGVGAGSEESAVYIYVDNDFSASNKVYFILASGWTPVTGHVTAGPSAVANSYSSGLFKYNSTLAPTASDDAWTTKLFDHIYVTADATTADLTPSGSTYNITIKSLVHQAKDANGDYIAAATIETAAINMLEN